MKRVDLAEFRERGIGLYSGNPRGQAVRKAAGLDAADQKGEEVVIVVPSDVFAVTASFLSGLLAPSIRTLGRDRFVEQYKFEGKSIAESLEAVIDYASKRRAAI